jgi:hypothetical protein
MNPLLLSALLSFGPSIVSKLFGGQDPKEKLRDEIMRLLDPKNQAALTGQFYQGNIGSPGYSQALGTIAAGANQTSNRVASSLAERGIGTTGTGAVLSGLTPSLVGSQTASLRTSAHDAALKQTEDFLRQRIAALTGTQGPSQNQQLFGAGLEAFGPYLQAYLKMKFPSLQFPTATTVAR